MSCSRVYERVSHFETTEPTFYIVEYYGAPEAFESSAFFAEIRI